MMLAVATMTDYDALTPNSMACNQGCRAQFIISKGERQYVLKQVCENFGLNLKAVLDPRQAEYSHLIGY